MMAPFSLDGVSGDIRVCWVAAKALTRLFHIRARDFDRGRWRLCISTKPVRGAYKVRQSAFGGMKYWTGKSWQCIPGGYYVLSDTRRAIFGEHFVTSPWADIPNTELIRYMWLEAR